MTFYEFIIVFLASFSIRTPLETRIKGNIGRAERKRARLLTKDARPRLPHDHRFLGPKLIKTAQKGAESDEFIGILRHFTLLLRVFRVFCSSYRRSGSLFEEARALIDRNIIKWRPHHPA